MSSAQEIKILLFCGCLLLVACMAVPATGQTCSVPTFRSYTIRNGREVETTTFLQNECFALECTAVQNDNHLRTIEVQGGSGLIYYIEKQFDITVYRTYVESIDPSTDTNRYTVHTKARNGNNGEAFTCQCGVSKSVIITVEDEEFGNCDGTQTTVTGTYNDGSVIGPIVSYGRNCTDKSFAGRTIALSPTVKYKNLAITFKKPASCTGIVHLWGVKQIGSGDCQLNIPISNRGDDHTFSIVPRNTADYTGGFPDCTDGSAALHETIRVMLVSPKGNTTMYEEVRITSVGFGITGPRPQPDTAVIAVSSAIGVCFLILGAIIIVYCYREHRKPSDNSHASIPMENKDRLNAANLDFRPPPWRTDLATLSNQNRPVAHEQQPQASGPVSFNFKDCNFLLFTDQSPVRGLSNPNHGYEGDNMDGKGVYAIASPDMM